jgi:hypothetical protein
MLLVSPITWPHYLVVLVVPIGLLVARVPAGWRRWVLVGCAALLWLPDNFVAWAVFGRSEALNLSVHRHHLLSAAETLLVASVPHYALLGLFALTLWLPASPGKTGHSEVFPAAGR